MNNLSIRPSLGISEYPALVAIWRSAVDATHNFLALKDRDEIEDSLATEYFPLVVLSVAVSDGHPVGFCGVLDRKLEMLFVDAEHRGWGIGTALLVHAMEQQDVTSLDVNEQNNQAVAFYTSRGFKIIGRTSNDEAGRPYPLLHLQRRMFD